MHKNMPSSSAQSSRRSSLSTITNTSIKSTICRICQGSQNSLIQACGCKGSSAFVHLPCLQQWNQCRLESGQSSQHCELCKSEYKVKDAALDKHLNPSVAEAYTEHVLRAPPTRCLNYFIKILSLVGYLSVHVGFLIAVTCLVFERATKMNTAEQTITAVVWSFFGCIWLAVGAYSIFKINQRSTV